MTPDEIDALLQRLPPPVPTPQLRDRVLADLDRRIQQDAAMLRGRRPPSRRSAWGGLALAIAIGGFAAILWVVLPGRPGDGVPGEGRGQSAEDPAFARRVWESAVGRGEISRLTLLDRLYAESPDGTLTAVDPGTGQVVWTFRTDAGSTFDYAPLIAPDLPAEILRLEAEIQQISKQMEQKLKGPETPETTLLLKKCGNLQERLEFAKERDHVYALCRQTLYCLNRSTGALKWTVQLSFAPSGPPCAIRNYLFVPDRGQVSVRVLDVEKRGAEVACYTTSGNPGNNAGPGGPVYRDPSLFFVAPSGTLYCYKVTDGTMTWGYWTEPAPIGELAVEVLRSFQRNNAGAARPVTTQLALFSTGSTLYCVDANGGNLLWKYDCGAPLVGKPILHGETVYVTTENHALLALEALPAPGNLRARAAKLRWRLADCTQFLMAGRQGLYVLGTNREILTVQESTGEVRGRTPSSPLSLFPRKVSDGLLYAVRPRGSIVCFKEAD